MGSPVSENSRRCFDCDYVADTMATECPQCGGAMITAASYRGRGWAILIAGLFLVIFIGVVTIREAVNVYHSGEPGAKVRYTGGTGIIVLMFGFLALLLSFGFAFIANGIWQILYGRPHSKLKLIIFGLWSLFMTAALVAAWARYIFG